MHIVISCFHWVVLLLLRIPTFKCSVHLKVFNAKLKLGIYKETYRKVGDFSQKQRIGDFYTSKDDKNI